MCARLLLNTSKYVYFFKQILLSVLRGCKRRGEILNIVTKDKTHNIEKGNLGTHVQ